MKIKYLGTGDASGIPALFCDCRICQNARKNGDKDIRSRTQVLIDDTLLIDFGPDSFYHAIKNKINFTKIAYCLISHTHYDHFFKEDIFSRTETRSKIRKNHPSSLTLIGSEGVKNVLKVEDNKVTRDGRVLFMEIKPYETIKVKNYEVTALPAEHGTESPLVYIIKDQNGKTFFYGHDSMILSDESFNYLVKNKIHLDILSLDFSDGKVKNPYFGHLNLDGVFHFKEQFLAKKIADPNSVFILSHIGHKGDFTHAELAKFMKGEFRVSFDGFTMKI